MKPEIRDIGNRQQDNLGEREKYICVEFLGSGLLDNLEVVIWVQRMLKIVVTIR